PPAPAAASSVADEIDWFAAAKPVTPAPPPELELPAPPAMDERPDLPLSAFAATAFAPQEHHAPPAPVAETPHTPISETAAPPAPVADPPTPVAGVPAPSA